MNFKTILAAAAISVLPAVASAVPVAPTVSVNGLTTTFNFGELAGGPSATPAEYESSTDLDVASNKFFNIEFEAGTVAGLLDLNLINSGASAGGNVEANLTLNGITTGTYNLLLDGVVKAVVPDGAASQVFTFSLGAGATKVLTWEWDGMPTNQLGQVSTNLTTQVPVPAGILLMGTALAGFGVMRRKAKKTA